MAVPSIQTSFAAGELSPSLYGHVDFAKYAIGASTMRNGFVSYRGGWFSRAGTALVGYSKQTVNNIATGSIFFPTNPVPGQNIILNGAAFEFVASGAVGFQFNIAGNAGGTISLAVIALNITFASNPLLNGATYSDSGGSTSDSLVVTWKSSGPSGNSYKLAADAPAVVSGPTLTGGGSVPPRLVTFQFSINQGLMLEFGHLYMRVVSQGAFVTETGSAITAITKASPALVTQATHGFSNSEWVFIDVVSGMIEVNGRTFVVNVVNANQYQLFDVYGNPIDSSGYTTYSSGGVGAEIYELATPYAAEDLPFLKFTQSADVMTLCLVNQETGTEYQSYDLARLADDNWTLTALDTTPPIAPPTNLAGTATVINTSTIGGLTDYQFVVTAIDPDTGRESIASNIADIPNSVDISAVAGSIDLVWDPVPGAQFYRIYKAPPAYMSTVPTGSLFGFAGDTFGVQFVDSNIAQDMLTVPPLHANPFLPGQAVSVTITSEGSSLLGPVGFTITPTPSDMPTGYGILVGGEMVDFVFTDFGGGMDAGDTITFFDAGGATATGYINFGVTNPSNGDTITLNSKVFTFVNDNSGFPNSTTNYKINIGFDLGGTLFFLADPVSGALNFSATYLADASLNVALYDVSATSLLITYKTSGVAGNAYTLAASAAAPSAGTLTGGTGGTAPTGTLNVGPTTGTYPSVPSYFQQRRVYANTQNQPDTYWMSQPGDFLNFDSRIPTIDSDAIVGTPWSVQVNGIQFMLPLLGGLIMLTGQAAYQVSGAGGSPTNPQPITPSSQQAVPQAYNGCHFHVPPVQIDYDIYYLQAKGSVIRNLSYNFWINVFTGVDITYLSSHMFVGFQIDTMSWCEEPFKLMWCVRDDGVLLCLTTLKNQEVMAWSRHDTQGLFAGSTAVTEPPVDALYLCTQRFIGTRAPFFIERMDDRIWASVEDAWCVDCALSLPLVAPNATLTVSDALGLGRPVSASDRVGGSGYGANTTITISDPTGSGCVVTPTIVSGVITALGFAGGSGYTQPLLQANDVDGGGGSGGSGFSAICVLDNTVELTVDTHVFKIGDIGSVVRAGGGILQVTAYVSSTHLTATVVSPIVATIPNTDGDLAPFDPNDWTMTPPVTTVTGLWHLVGESVTGLADGNVITPQVVAADGTITLDDPASAIVVGLGFSAQLQSLYLNGGNPTLQGRRKNIGAVTVRLSNSGAIDAGINQPDGAALSPARVETTWTNMAEAPLNQPGLVAIPFGENAAILDSDVVRALPLYTGDVRVPVAGGFAKPGQLAVQQTLPLPIEVLAFIPETDVGDDPETGRGGAG